MKVYLAWTGYEDVGGVFSTRENAEAYILEHLRQYNASHAFQRTREHYSNIEMTVDEWDRD